MTDDYRFDFAISFAGPHRKTAREISTLLATAGFTVFYDEDFEHEMIGHDGIEYLRRVYSSESRYCVVLISQEYDQRDWTYLELESINSRMLKGERGYLIPVKVEEYQPAWLPASRIFFDLKSRPLTDLVAVLSKKADPRFVQLTPSTIGEAVPVKDGNQLIEKFIKFDFALAYTDKARPFEFVYCCDLTGRGQCNEQMLEDKMPEMRMTLERIVKRWGAGWLENMGPKEIGDLHYQFDAQHDRLAHIFWFHQEGDHGGAELAKRSASLVWRGADWKILAVVGVDMSAGIIDGSMRSARFLLDLHDRGHRSIAKDAIIKSLFG